MASPPKPGIPSAPGNTFFDISAAFGKIQQDRERRRQRKREEEATAVEIGKSTFADVMSSLTEEDKRSMGSAGVRGYLQSQAQSIAAGLKNKGVGEWGLARFNTHVQGNTQNQVSPLEKQELLYADAEQITQFHDRTNKARDQVAQGIMLLYDPKSTNDEKAAAGMMMRSGQESFDHEFKSLSPRNRAEFGAKLKLEMDNHSRDTWTTVMVSSGRGREAQKLLRTGKSPFGSGLTGAQRDARIRDIDNRITARANSHAAERRLAKLQAEEVQKVAENGIFRAIRNGEITSGRAYELLREAGTPWRDRVSLVSNAVTASDQTLDDDEDAWALTRKIQGSVESVSAVQMPLFRSMIDTLKQADQISGTQWEMLDKELNARENELARGEDPGSRSLKDRFRANWDDPLATIFRETREVAGKAEFMISPIERAVARIELGVEKVSDYKTRRRDRDKVGDWFNEQAAQVQIDIRSVSQIANEWAADGAHDGHQVNERLFGMRVNTARRMAETTASIGRTIFEGKNSFQLNYEKRLQILDGYRDKKVDFYDFVHDLYGGQFTQGIANDRGGDLDPADVAVQYGVEEAQAVRELRILYRDFSAARERRQ